MFDFWLADENILFAIGGFLLFALMLLQLLGVSDFGPDFDILDSDADIDVDIAIGDGIDDALSAPSFMDGLLSFLGLGRLPMMMWVALYLMSFTMIGYAGQQFIEMFSDNLLPLIIAAPLAALLALPLTALLSRPLAFIMPKDETTAVSIDSLVGRFAEIQIGTARIGFAARAKVIDRHGNSHFIMVEPDNEGQIFVKGEKLLIVRREGNNFKAISQGKQHIPHLDND